MGFVALSSLRIYFIFVVMDNTTTDHYNRSPSNKNLHAVINIIIPMRLTDSCVHTKQINWGVGNLVETIWLAKLSVLTMHFQLHSSEGVTYLFCLGCTRRLG